YFEYCDACTNALFERAGLPKPEILKSYGIGGIPLVEARARFIVPSQFGDTVTVESCVSEWGRSSFSVHHKIFKEDVLALEIFEKRVWVERIEGDTIRYKGIPVPEEVKARFSRPSGAR
ncbi:MAG: thioesterase family protein, partial [Candidatus Acidiferrales bacterium]